MFLNTPVLDEIFHLSPTMDFTDEENEWLEKISLEIPGQSELTALEEHLRDQAKPSTALIESVNPIILSASTRPTMDFTDEENEWLEKISLEIPGQSELTALEEHLRDQAKPSTALEALMFQITASLRFGLTKQLSPIPVSPSDNRSIVSSQ